MATSTAREAARARAAEERQRQQQRKRRLTVALVAGIGAAVVVIGGGTAVALGTARFDAGESGRTTLPPWSAPADVEARVHAAGLRMLSSEGAALHTHQHLTVTVDGHSVTVPADLGVDEAARRLSAIHTHDDSGVIHVESPDVRTFRLDQVFTEWNVRLAPGRIGPYENGEDGARVTVFVNHRRYAGDPNEIALTQHQDIDFVVTHGTTTPTPPDRFVWPSDL